MTRHKKGTIEEEKANLRIRSMIGERIRLARERKRFSVQTVAEKVGITRSGLTQIETNRSNVSALLLWKIACFLHCSIIEFFPEVPESSLLMQNDIDRVEKINKEAADLAQKAFKIK